jgi:hypothetical protein
VSVLDVLARRQEGGPDHAVRVALVVEGGGSRATFSAGMAAAVEDRGLTPLLDDVYGVSAGSLNAAWLVAGKAREAMSPWTDRSVMRGTIDPRRVLRGGRAVDLSHLAAEGRLLHVRPPDDAPAVSRTSTDVGLLADALRIGHEAASSALDGLPSHAP